PFTIRLSGRRLFAGVVDRLARRPDGSIVVVDYKTSRRPPRALDDDASLQLRSYGVYALIARRTDLVRLEYQYLSTGAALRDVIGPREANDVVHRLTARIDLIAAARSWMPKPSSLCGWCGYSPFCSAATASSDFAAPPDERETCPRCGGRLVPRSGVRGPFLGCAHFPECRFARDP
ncbi:MAG: PD-(D/E)XK nuclease family protein, partial [Candidatus Polarisedimenticolia bacterium]